MRILEKMAVKLNILEQIEFIKLYPAVGITKSRLFSFKIDFTWSLLKMQKVFCNSIAFLQKLIWQRFLKSFLFGFGDFRLKCLMLIKSSIAWYHWKYLKWDGSFVNYLYYRKYYSAYVYSVHCFGFF